MSEIKPFGLSTLIQSSNNLNTVELSFPFHSHHLSITTGFSSTCFDSTLGYPGEGPSEALYEQREFADSRNRHGPRDPRDNKDVNKSKKNYKKDKSLRVVRRDMKVREQYNGNNGSFSNTDDHDRDEFENVFSALWSLRCALNVNFRVVWTFEKLDHDWIISVVGLRSDDEKRPHTFPDGFAPRVIATNDPSGAGIPWTMPRTRVVFRGTNYLYQITPVIDDSGWEPMYSTKIDFPVMSLKRFKKYAGNYIQNCTVQLLSKFLPFPLSKIVESYVTHFCMHCLYFRFQNGYGDVGELYPLYCQCLCAWSCSNETCLRETVRSPWEPPKHIFSHNCRCRNLYRIYENQRIIDSTEWTLVRAQLIVDDFEELQRNHHTPLCSYSEQFVTIARSYTNALFFLRSQLNGQNGTFKGDCDLSWFMESTVVCKKPFRSCVGRHAHRIKKPLTGVLQRLRNKQEANGAPREDKPAKFEICDKEYPDCLILEHAHLQEPPRYEDDLATLDDGPALDDELADPEPVLVEHQEVAIEEKAEITLSGSPYSIPEVWEEYPESEESEQEELLPFRGGLRGGIGECEQKERFGNHNQNTPVLDRGLIASDQKAADQTFAERSLALTAFVERMEAKNSSSEAKKLLDMMEKVSTNSASSWVVPAKTSDQSAHESKLDEARRLRADAADHRLKVGAPKFYMKASAQKFHISCINCRGPVLKEESGDVCEECTLVAARFFGDEVDEPKEIRSDEIERKHDVPDALKQDDAPLAALEALTAILEGPDEDETPLRVVNPEALDRGCQFDQVLGPNFLLKKDYKGNCDECFLYPYIICDRHAVPCNCSIEISCDVCLRFLCKQHIVSCCGDIKGELPKGIADYLGKREKIIDKKLRILNYEGVPVDNVRGDHTEILSVGLVVRNIARSLGPSGLDPEKIALKKILNFLRGRGIGGLSYSGDPALNGIGTGFLSCYWRPDFHIPSTQFMITRTTCNPYSPLLSLPVERQYNHHPLEVEGEEFDPRDWRLKPLIEQTWIQAFTCSNCNVTGFSCDCDRNSLIADRQQRLDLIADGVRGAIMRGGALKDLCMRVVRNKIESRKRKVENRNQSLVPIAPKFTLPSEFKYESFMKVSPVVIYYSSTLEEIKKSYMGKKWEDFKDKYVPFIHKDDKLILNDDNQVSVQESNALFSTTVRTWRFGLSSGNRDPFDVTASQASRYWLSGGFKSGGMCDIFPALFDHLMFDIKDDGIKDLNSRQAVTSGDKDTEHKFMISKTFSIAALTEALRWDKSDILRRISLTIYENTIQHYIQQKFCAGVKMCDGVPANISVVFQKRARSSTLRTTGALSASAQLTATLMKPIQKTHLSITAISP